MIPKVIAEISAGRRVFEGWRGGNRIACEGMKGGWVWVWVWLFWGIVRVLDGLVGGGFGMVVVVVAVVVSVFVFVVVVVVVAVAVLVLGGIVHEIKSFVLVSVLVSPDASLLTVKTSEFSATVNVVVSV